MSRICVPDHAGTCAQPPSYHKGYDRTYWYPLGFDARGNVQQFANFTDSFELELTGADGHQ